MTVRTRIAPSPTGEMHIGTLRTALYNYALAKKNDGQFIVRIEDTDRERLVAGSDERLLDTLTEFGFEWDEGPRVGGPFTPYIQSERLPIYQKYASELVEKGKAYYCFCSSERLEKVREEQRQKGLPTTRYDRHCRSLGKDVAESKIASGESYVIRLKVPDNQLIKFHDVILGDIEFSSNEIDDQILIKSDGFPTYQLAVVIDDHLMEISHVLRGVEWLPSTPKHLLLYEAFGWTPPLHGHMPNLKESGSNAKMSKRFGNVAAEEFLRAGYLPEATLNFLMLLGWTPEDDQEIMSLKEFIAKFSIERIHKTDLVVFDRPKLLWFNGYYIRQLSPAELYTKLLAWSKKFNVDLGLGESSEEYILKVITVMQERLKLLSEFVEQTSYFFKDPPITSELLSKYSSQAEKVLNDFKTTLESDVKWTKENLDTIGHELIAAKGYKPKEAFMTLRLAVTNTETTPPLFDTLAILGSETTLRRIKKAIDACQKSA